jgi:intraflagellar transport protein 88
LEGDLKNAEKYANIAVSTNRYNGKAQNYLGNCYHLKGDFEKAREYYMEAVSVDALCVEAMYNLGLAYKEKSSFSDALIWFEKLHSILKSGANASLLLKTLPRSSIHPSSPGEHAPAIASVHAKKM